MKPAMIRPKVARLVVGAVGVALAAAMSALLAQSGALDWRAALMAAGTALGAWVVKQPWQDVLGELLEQLPPDLAADVSESLRPTRPTRPPEA